MLGVGYKDEGLICKERPELMLRISLRSAKKNFLVSGIAHRCHRYRPSKGPCDWSDIDVPYGHLDDTGQYNRVTNSYLGVTTALTRSKSEVKKTYQKRNEVTYFRKMHLMMMGRFSGKMGHHTHKSGTRVELPPKPPGLEERETTSVKMTRPNAPL